MKSKCVIKIIYVSKDDRAEPYTIYYINITSNAVRGKPKKIFFSANR